jgi:putrescine transport system ATP-binding protein
MIEKNYTRKEKDNLLERKPLVLVDNISKQFSGNEFKSVDNISLTINEGELFALLGPSGCGKTTLMRMIAGFEMPSEGKITIDGVDMTDIPPYQRPVNIMFQSYALFPHMNVEQNVAFGLHQEKLPKEEIRGRVKEALAMVKMSEFAHRKPRQLSGGQQQRVALARSLVKRPRLLLLDEPLGALDRKTREHTQMELINIQMMLGITFVMVTHDQEEAMAMANRIAVMKSGHIMQIGTPEEIYEYPRSRFVADFIGAINLFEGTVTSGRDEKEMLRVESAESGSEIRVQSSSDIPLHSKVWVAVRPEEMAISISAALPEENQISGKIIDIAFLGDKILYHVALQNEKIIHVSVPTSARGNNAELVFGSNVVVSWYDTDGVVLTD